MKFLFCGLGSIGCRHLRNLDRILHDRNIPFQVDALRSTDSSLAYDITDLLNTVYRRAIDVPGGYDAVFVTNPTALHYETLLGLKGKADCYFIEKPIFDIPYDLETLALPEGRTYVAAPLRFHPVILRAKQITERHAVYAARATCSSYLPEWRSGTDYRTSYSADLSMGGGVALDLIHEWDYLGWLFGYPEALYCIREHISALEINADDIAVYIAKAPTTVLSVHLDYFGRQPQRRLEMWCREEVIVADLLDGTIRYRSGRPDETPGTVDLHYREMEYFLKVVIGGIASNHGAETAVQTLKLALGEWD